MTAEERRKHERIASLNLVNFSSYRHDVLTKQGMGRTLDVSEGGILLEIHSMMDPEDQLELTIGIEDDLVEIKGRVVYCNEEEGGTFRLGVEFLEVGSEALGVLAQYITQFDDLQDQNGK